MLNALEAACLTVLWVVSEPTVWLRLKLGFDDLKYADMGAAKAAAHRMMNCALCSGFWIGLAVTQSPGLAAVAAVLAEIITRKINGQDI